MINSRLLMHFPHQNAQVCSKHACKKPFINMTGARTLETLSGCCQLLLFGCSQIQTLLFVQFFTHSKNRGRPIHSHRDVQRLGPVLTEHVNVIIPPHTMRKLTIPCLHRHCKWWPFDRAVQNALDGPGKICSGAI